MKNTKIEWADHTFNPWIGCTKVSSGCANCYAESLNNRMKWTEWGRGGVRKRTSVSNWNKPRVWNKTSNDSKPRVFCASLADWLDDEVPIEWLSDLLNLISETPNINWLLLTKRPENWYKRLSLAEGEMAESWIDCIDMPDRGCIPENVWIGTSAEDQINWDKRVPLLMKIPANVRFVSAEPLLGPIQMSEQRPDWLIVGGESGPKSRPLKSEWVEDLRDQCDNRTSFFFKQWGGVEKIKTGRKLNGRTYDYIPDQINHQY